eukprot:1156087-Pelagomonas_calceolata.AAC.3
MDVLQARVVGFGACKSLDVLLKRGLASTLVAMCQMKQERMLNGAGKEERPDPKMVLHIKAGHWVSKGNKQSRKRIPCIICREQEKQFSAQILFLFKML